MVIDIIKNVFLYLNRYNEYKQIDENYLDDIVSYIPEGEETPTTQRITHLEDFDFFAEIEDFLSILNVIKDEIVDFFKFFKNFTITSTGYLSAGDFNISNGLILKVNGNTLTEPIKINRESIEFQSGTYDFFVKYVPKDYTLFDDVDYGEKAFSDNIFVYGILKNFYLSKGLFEEAEIFEKKYENLILEEKKKIKNFNLKFVEWLWKKTQQNIHKKQQKFFL